MSICAKKQARTWGVKANQKDSAAQSLDQAFFLFLRKLCQYVQRGKVNCDSRRSEKHEASLGSQGLPVQFPVKRITGESPPIKICEANATNTAMPES